MVHSIPGSSNISDSADDKSTSPPPRPIDDSAGSRIKAFFGATCHEFVLLFHEDDGNKSWQSKVWCNIPVGLDAKLRSLDTIIFCSFTANDWFLLTQCDQTGKYKSYWNVESSVLHTALTTYAQSNTYIRLVFGENGQYVLLHGTNGYQVGPNIPAQLQTSLDRAYTTGQNIVGVHGLNAHGRFIIHVLKHDTHESQQPLASFNAQGLSTHLDQTLRAANKAEHLRFVLSINDTSWIMFRDHSFERTEDLHYDLVMELDGFYSRHKKRQEKRSEEIEKFYENERLRQSTRQLNIPPADCNQIKTETENATTMFGKNAVVVPAKTYNKNGNKAKIELKVAPISDHSRRSDPNAKQKSKKKKELKPLMLRAQTLLAKEDRLSEIYRKGINVGDKVTVLGVSGMFGDFDVKSIESNDGSVIVVPNDIGGKKKTPGEKATTVTDIRRLIKYVEGDELANHSGFFKDSLPSDKYEAALELFHIQCKDGACDCKANFFGSTERFQLASLWKEGDRVNVLGYADGTVIKCNQRYTSKPYLVHVQYDDGTSYHVRSDQVRPLKRYIDPGSCCFASLREHEESALRLRPVLDEIERCPFDEYKCSERIDLRRLQRLVSTLRADSNLRKECMKSLVVALEEDPDDLLADQCYSQLEYCYDIEECLYMLYEHVKSLPMDDNGCVTYEVRYSHKNFACRGRLFANGRSVLALPGKFPRTATIQGMHAELHAPLTGAFAHHIDCQNSDVRLLCSLADQLALGDKIPSLKDYCYNRDNWIATIHEEHPQVDLSNIKRLVNIILYGGSYETWLRLVGEEDVVPKLKRFTFRIDSEMQVLIDQLVHHPRFQWTFLERKKLEAQGLTEESVKRIVFIRILQACENELQGIIHRTFHKYGWIVRTKYFDSMLVERGPNVAKDCTVLTDMMQNAERKCDSMKWDIKLVEKQMYGCEDEPVHAFSEARSLMRKFLRRQDNDDEDFVDDYEDDDEYDDEDDDLLTTMTRSVDTAEHTSTNDEMDEDELFCHETLNAAVGAYDNSFDLQNESTFHDESDNDELVRSIELPLHYRVTDGNNGSKDSMGN